MTDIVNDAAALTEAREENTALSLDDIQNAVMIIDYAADQGAFRGWSTIEQVLSVRARLKAFLGAAQDSMAAPADETDTTAIETV